MRFHLLVLSILLGAVIAAMLSLPGCAAQAPKRASPPPLRAVYTASIQGKTYGPLAVYPLEDADFGRGERVAQGPAEISSIEIFSELTYDPQRIGLRRDGGYRNRYLWRQTLTLP